MVARLVVVVALASSRVVVAPTLRGGGFFWWWWLPLQHDVKEMKKGKERQTHGLTQTTKDTEIHINEQHGEMY